MADDSYKCYFVVVAFVAGYCGYVCCYWTTVRCSLYYRYSLLLWLVKFKSLIIIRHNMDDDDKSALTHSIPEEGLWSPLA